ncbi:Cardiolipin synthase (CMP-forming) / mitochondrial hydrolase fusion protein-like protein [Drosera capensis]
MLRLNTRSIILNHCGCSSDVPPFALRFSFSPELRQGGKVCHNLGTFSNPIPNCITSSAPLARPSFGIAFDIDGVLVRGNTPIGGSPNALMRLYDDYGSLKVPYVFLTNGGGIPESRRALEMSKLFGLNITESQGHSPFKQLVKRFQNKFVVAVGKGEPAAVMTAYGFRNVLGINDYASCFDDIDPLSPYKRWSLNKISDFENCKFEVQNLRDYVNSQRVEAVFVVSDSVDWSGDIQVLCDILRTGGLPGTDVKYGQQPPLYFAHDDLAYQARFPTERFGMGAFRIALESVFNSMHSYPLLYTAVGKPNSSAFKNAEAILMQLYHQCVGKPIDICGNGVNPLKTIYMIGDNPSVDIKGALQAGKPWFSILTRTGVFKGKENDGKFPADMVVDTVEDAVEYIFTREGWKGLFCMKLSGQKT